MELHEGPFGGVIGRYRRDSTPWWPPVEHAAPGAPNVMIIVLDDVGFAQLGCFGSDIPTPNLDRLAAGGVRYSNFHTTALCSPTRASVLTGRNHHAVGMGRVTDLATGFPGYDAHIPRSAGMLSEMLVPYGYATWAVGKWHLTPDEESTLASSRRTWPLGRGFERYYGFFHGETNQFAPALVHDNHRCVPPAAWEDGYHLTEDLVDHAQEMIRDLRHVDPTKPFFLWFATGACHSPHQAPAEWIARFRGAFDGGWDAWREETARRQREAGVLPPDTELSPRPPWVPAWDSLTEAEQRLFARYMECFAAYLAHTDHEVGRLLATLEETGDLHNTMIVVLSDNGASSEGGPEGSINDVRPWNLAERPMPEALARIDEIGGPWIHNNYPWGWTVAGNTPFRRWKREVHEGGVCDPLIVHWPAGIAPESSGSVRRQYLHAVDIVPTVLDALGVEAPREIDGIEQQRIDGVSFRTTFDAPDAPEVRTLQYFEMLGSRALYHDGWKAVTYVSMSGGEQASDADDWELYHVATDISECHDLAAEEPERLAAMIELWWREAERNQVLPVDNQPFIDAMFGRPSTTPPRGRYVYWPGSGPVEECAAVNVRNRSHTITAQVEIPEAGGEGILLQQGSGYGGFVLWMQGGRLHYVHNFVSLEESRVSSDAPIAPGVHELTVRYVHEGPGGRATLVVDGVEDASVVIPRFTATRWAITGDGLTCGWSAGLPVVADHRSPFSFTGTLHRVVVEVEGEAFVDARAEFELAMRRQ